MNQSPRKFGIELLLALFVVVAALITVGAFATRYQVLEHHRAGEVWVVVVFDRWTGKSRVEVNAP